MEHKTQIELQKLKAHNDKILKQLKKESVLKQQELFKRQVEVHNKFIFHEKEKHTRKGRKGDDDLFEYNEGPSGDDEEQSIESYDGYDPAEGGYDLDG